MKIKENIKDEDLFECIHKGSIKFGPDNEITCEVVQKMTRYLELFQVKECLNHLKEYNMVELA